MKKFYLGMDIGTNSVGMACTDENYDLLRAKGKDCWAVRLFDKSNTAVKRRTFRTARRRLARRRQRIGFLQSLFAPLMSDELFFIRLNNSQFFPEDKDAKLGGDKNTLFADDSFDDKSYHAKYPTIYHLRKALMTEGITDLRLYYLALHHIVKYRGHFLFEGGMAEIRDITNLFTQLNEVCSAIYDEDIPNFDTSLSQEAKEILLNGYDKQKRLEALFGVTSPVSKEIIKCICGYSAKPKVLFNGKYAEEKSIAFKDMSDEAFEALQAIYEDDFILLSAMRSIYNFVTFEKLLEGHPDVSSAMIALYDKHGFDLKRLKDFVHTNGTQEDYNRLFKAMDQTNNYVNYVGYTKKGGDKKKVAHCKDEDFFAYLKKFISNLPNVQDEAEKTAILQEIENGTFLPKILHADNGLFPHQINEDELNKIIANMVRNIPETKKIADKILPVFLYRIPYFVGPLTGKNSWVKRNGNEKITPWNFDEAIDKAGSNEDFMRRMTNKCSYLHGEDVLPKASIYYQRFNVLNQINKLKINDQPISIELKQAIYNELFKTKKKVSDYGIKDLLVRRGEISLEQKKEVTISGKDGELNASLSSYIQFKNIFGEEFVDADLLNEDSVCEKIILWHTLNTDKKIVEDLILKNYGKMPVIAKNIKKLRDLTFKDFGRLSKKLLTDLKTLDIETGAYLSILDILYETNDNLNEILFNEKYGFASIIKEENGEVSSEITYEDIEKLYVSPAVRRGIWQSLKMAEEYVSALGKTPDKIFIEVTRKDGEKGDAGRTASRQKQLLEKYKGIEGIEGLTDSLKNTTDMRLRQERLYLYYRQLGKCMYSGEQIDLDSLNSNRYDVDHILPRSYIKDDSLDNKVLVCRECNAEKSNIYPVPSNVVTESARAHWKVLYKKGLISDTTYKRLTRVEPLGENDYNDFINRQKTITDQTVKAVAELLARKYPESKIVYSKAKNVSEFRQKFDLFKCRETNDLHHAKDAYLNIVVGNVFDSCFSTPISYRNKDGDVWKTYNLKTMFHRNVSGAWVNDDNCSLNVVKSICAQARGINVTRYSFCNKGAFYDQTVYDHNVVSITAPRKQNSQLNDVAKYGGYKSQKTAYFAIVQSEGKKGKILKTIEAVPVLIDYKSKNDPQALQEYFNGYLQNAKVLVPKLKIKQLVKYNGTPCYLAGVTGNYIIVHNGVELFTDNKTDEYVNALSKIVEMKKNNAIDGTEEEYVVKTNREGIIKLAVTKENNIALFDMLLSKLERAEYQGISPFVTYKNNLLKAKNNFINLKSFNQVEILLQIIKFFKCNAETSNLTQIGGSANSGKVLFNSDIAPVDFRIVHQSPCGLTSYEQKV